MRPSKPPNDARITEIFSSLQGEGPRMGERHIFIRFEACHMACAYCDEAQKKGRPLSLGQILREVERLEKYYGPHAYVSLTGGEPLLYADFLKSLCPALQKRRFRVLLETNGILWRELSKVLSACDMIAMDLKLSSVTRQNDFLEEHRKFLRLAKKKKVYLKVVISEAVDRCDYEKHLRMVASVAPQVPVFLQPMDPGGSIYPPPWVMKLLDELQRTGAKRLPDVRVGIQLHKLLKFR